MKRWKGKGGGWTARRLARSRTTRRRAARGAPGLTLSLARPCRRALHTNSTNGGPCCDRGVAAGGIRLGQRLDGLRHTDRTAPWRRINRASQRSKSLIRATSHCGRTHQRTTTGKARSLSDRWSCRCPENACRGVLTATTGEDDGDLSRRGPMILQYEVLQVRIGHKRAFHIPHSSWVGRRKETRVRAWTAGGTGGPLICSSVG